MCNHIYSLLLGSMGSCMPACEVLALPSREAGLASAEDLQNVLAHAKAARAGPRF